MGSELLESAKRLRDEKKAQYEAAERILRDLEKVIGIESGRESYAGMSKRDAAILYLRRHGGSAEFSVMLRDLTACGCELGKRGLSNLKTTITANPKTFAWDGERVMLQETRRTKAA